jgi:Flp pilus assembly protein TadG
MNKHSDERGQVFVLTTIALVCMTALSAFVLDIGAWFRDHREMQRAADAGALAGAQALPNNPSQASQLASQYATQDGASSSGTTVSFGGTGSCPGGPTDTICVTAKQTDPGFFSKVLGINSVNIKADAAARVGVPGQAQYVAPMVVSCNHPLIQNCNGNHTPTFGVTTVMNFDPMGAPGAFGMLDLSNSGGNVGSSTLGSWIQNGYGSYLGLGLFDSDPGAKFSSQNVNGSLNNRIGTTLLFPVFDTLNGGGSNAQYDIIGWIGFYLQAVVVQGNNAVLTGYFTTYIAHGILPSSGNGSTNFGVTSIQLIK